MRRGRIAGAAFVAMLVLLALAGRQPGLEQDVDPVAATSSEVTPSTAPLPEGPAHEGLLYGRVTTDDSAVYEGRLRWGG